MGIRFTGPGKHTFCLCRQARYLLDSPLSSRSHMQQKYPHSSGIFGYKSHEVFRPTCPRYYQQTDSAGQSACAYRDIASQPAEKSRERADSWCYKKQVKRPTDRWCTNKMSRTNECIGHGSAQQSCFHSCSACTSYAQLQPYPAVYSPYKLCLTQPKDAQPCKAVSISSA